MLRFKPHFFNFIRLAVAFILIGPAYANPVLKEVTAGNVQISQETNTVTIHQASPQAIINWESFNIQPGERTSFQQPANGITLNKINPSQASEINGQLSANSRIILINGGGIHFGPKADVNVAGLIASATSGISDQKFMQGKYIFDQPLEKMGSIINEGSIKASDNGLVVLVGNNVINSGIIEANLGFITLAAAEQFVVNIPKPGFTDGLIYFVIDTPVSKDGYVKNTGKIIADGGKIGIAVNTVSTMLDNVINLEGVIQANAIAEHDGVIEIYEETANHVSSTPHTGVLINGLISSTGDKNSKVPSIFINSENDAVRINGEINTVSTSQGGLISIGGHDVFIGDGAKLDASGSHGGGAVGLLADRSLVVSEHANISADTYQEGWPGLLIFYAKRTHILGDLSIKGGSEGGKGGFAMISGEEEVEFTKKIDISSKVLPGSWTVYLNDELWDHS
jgi:filamentous hemagglutinin family protein